MRVFLLLLLFSISITALAQTEEELQTLEERGYGIYIPSGYDGSEDVPLLIGLHGFGDVWENFANYSGFMRLAEEYNFIAAFPNGYLRQWNDGGRGDHYEDDVRMLQVMIERVALDYRINRERVYLVGFSNGGTMVYKAACEAPDVFAGIAAVGGTMRYEQECPDDVQLPVIIIHGAADNTVPFMGGDGRWSVPNTAAFWINQNECSTENMPDYDPEFFINGAIIYHFEECPNGNQVLLYAIEEMGHIWPGSSYYFSNQAPPAPIDTPRWIWSFFEVSYQASLEAEVTPEASPEATESAP